MEQTIIGKIVDIIREDELPDLVCVRINHGGASYEYYATGLVGRILERQRPDDIMCVVENDEYITEILECI